MELHDPDMITRPPAVSPASTIRKAAQLAILARALQVIGLAAEWFLQPQSPDGTVLRPFVLAGCVLAWTAGAGLMIAVLLCVRSAHHESGRALPRSGRLGIGIGAAGNAAVLISGTVVLVTGLAMDQPAEWSFLFFAVGYLLAVGGYVALGLGLRGPGLVGRLWLVPLVAAAGIACAIVISIDPWHDIGLATAYLAWMIFGILLLRTPPTEPFCVPDPR